MALSARQLWSRLSRRDFLRLASMLSLSPLASKQSYAAEQRPSFSQDPFSLGVAAGDPASDGFVIWTRLAPEPLSGGGLDPVPLAVRWEIATDESFRHITQSGNFDADPNSAHSVHVEAVGLEQNRPYFYRFMCGDAVSPTGHAKTLPDSTSSIDQFRFAFASCQHYEHGYYHAYRDMVEQHPDMIIHLGDYIYEGPGTKTYVRQVPGKEIETLEEYRNRYGIYKSDPNLKRAHQSCAWLVTWDDHEFDNNYASGHSEIPDADPVAFLARRASAYQAYYEHMPLRAHQKPTGPDLQLYRTLNIADLVSFNMLDTRQYRTPQPCGDNNKPPCDGVFDPNAHVLGPQQEAWLQSQLGASRARWNVLAQQIMMGRVDRDATEGVKWSMDQWAGYDAPRKRLLRWIEEHRIANPVVLTGDIHSNWVNELKYDFDNPNDPNLAVEFVGTSISSGGDGKEVPGDSEGVLRDNSFVKFYNAERGYVLCDLDQREWRSDYRVVQAVTQPTSEVFSRAKFVVERGQHGTVHRA